MKTTVRMIVLLIFVFLSVDSFAQSHSYQYEFARDYIKSLQQLKKIADREIGQSAKKSKDELALRMETTANFRRAHADLLEAKDLMLKHKGSSQALVREIVKMVVRVYEQRIEINKSLQRYYDKLYSPEVVDNLGEYQKEYATQMNRLTVESDESFKLLMYCSSLVAYSLVSKTPDKDGNLSNLVITAKERKDLINELNSAFKKEARKGLRVGQNYLNICAAILYEILEGDYKPAKE